MADQTKTATKTKKAVAKKPAAHPTYIDMITAAIGALKERNGSSRQAIAKYIAANYKVDADKMKSHLRAALVRGVANKKLVQPKGTGASGSFKLNQAAAKADASAKAKKEKAKKKSAADKEKKAAKKATKKPSAKKAKKPAAKKTKSPKKAKKSAKSPKKASKPTKATKSPKKPKASKPKNLKAKKASKSPKKAAKLKK